jgi:hypothetical protein
MDEQRERMMTHTQAFEAIGYQPAVRWVCGVVRSGYHNGAGCHPTDPHQGWGCGYRVEVSVPITEEEYEQEMLPRPTAGIVR